MLELNVKPNLQLIYVSDISKSTQFYKMIFNTEPIFESPRYVAFAADGKAIFALWTGGGAPNQETPRFSEIGIMLPSNNDVENLYKQWRENDEICIEKGIYQEVFGLTFLVRDPDGHILRVCPVD